MAQNQLPKIMRRMPIFKVLSNREIALLSLVLKDEVYAPDEHLMTEGEPGDSCCFLVSGEVDIVKSINDEEEAVLTTIEAPETIGQVSLVDAGPRSASCIARTSVRVFRLSRREFETLFSSASMFARNFQKLIGSAVARQLREAQNELRILIETEKNE